MIIIDFDFLLRSAQNCKKCTFSDNFRTVTQEGNMETRQITPFSYLRFPNLEISEFGNTQNSLSCSPFFGPFWSVEYLNFWPKATDSDSSSYFSRK